MRPVCQLSSMNRRIDAWSVSVWSTKLVFAYGRDHQQRQPRAVAAAVRRSRPAASGRPYRTRRRR